MFNDYEKVRNMVKKSFSEIEKEMVDKELTYEEIKDLMVKTLYQVAVEDKKGKVRVERVEMPQVLYGPPKMEEVEVHTVVMPQVLYGPPPRQNTEMHEMFGEGAVPKPRPKNPNETEEDYVSYLEKFYGTYFPNSKGPRAR